jgi:F0F1-type ATP synthase assembly protein I
MDPVAPGKSAEIRNQFVTMAVTMTWQLAIAVLVPIIAGVQIGKAVHDETTGVIVGLVVAVTGSVVVMRRTVQAANHVEVPKLTPVQKRAVQKQYEEDDK